MPERRSSSLQTVMAASMAFSALVGAVAGGISSFFVVNFVRSSTLLGSVATESLIADSAALRALQDDERATISVVKQVAPSVVSVVIRRPFEGKEGEYVDIGGGTGLIVSADGYIVTNRHVVDDPEAIFAIVTDDGAELPARVAARDPLLDIAILDVEGTGYPVATLGNSDAVEIGQTVIAVGNTLSAFRNTVTKGVISGVNRTVYAGDARIPGDTIENAIQTDAAINPGNSGGPLVNLRGEVVGINTAVSFDGQSVGFAIPANEIKRAVTDVERHGRVVRPWLGVRYGMIDEEFARREDLPVPQGALIGGDEEENGVVPDSPAAKAGLRDGDIVVSVNGRTLGPDLSLGRAVAGLLPGDEVAVRVLRDGKSLDLLVTLGEYPSTN